MFSKLLKVSVLTLLTYLLQATVSEYISVWDVAPNIALALIAVITVCLGRKYTFIISLAIGYLLEVMLPSLDYINLIIYPVCAMLGAIVFADKSERALEEAKSGGREIIQLHPHIRTPLCAGVSILMFEIVNLLYIYLSGVSLDSGHFLRSFICILYTMVLAGIFQFPIRLWLGTYKLKKAR